MVLSGIEIIDAAAPPATKKASRRDKESPLVLGRAGAAPAHLFWFSPAVRTKNWPALTFLCSRSFRRANRDDSK